jgi:epoxide hydrolase 4
VQRGATHALAVDRGAVRGGEILQDPDAVAEGELCVPARDARVRDDDVACGMASDQQALVLGAIQHQQHRQLRRLSESGGGTHAGEETVPRVSCRVEGSRSGAAEREVADQLLLVDQMRTEQKAEPVDVRLLAEQTFGERRVQDTRKTLAWTTERGHATSIPRSSADVHAAEHLGHGRWRPWAAAARREVYGWRDGRAGHSDRAGPRESQVSVAPEVVDGVSEAYADVNGVRLHYAEAGSGPLVVLLHGFPAFWYSWRHQIPALAQAGYHVVAPDMRGYNLSSKPSGWRAYDAESLAGDIAGLIRHFGVEEAYVAGHDWGAAVAYLTAMEHPEVVKRLAILNVPHPARMLASFRTSRQLRKSWYMFFFQLPVIPERLLAARDFAAAKRALRIESPHAFSDAEVERYVEAWSQPGALTAMLNYYRAALRRSPRSAKARMRRIDAPVLVIWGERDSVLGSELAEPEARWVSDVRVERLPKASHWVQNDAPERVNELLTGFFAASD